MESRKARVRRQARRQGLTAKEEKGGWTLSNPLTHEIEPVSPGGGTKPVSLDVVEAWLASRQRLGGGQA